MRHARQATDAELDAALDALFESPQPTIREERKTLRKLDRAVHRRTRQKETPDAAKTTGRDEPVIGAWAIGTEFDIYYKGLRKMAKSGVHKTGARKGKRRNARAETAEQRAGVRWFAKNYPMFLLSLHASLGGVFMPTTVRSELNLNGYQNGTPDLFIAVPAWGKPGLFVENKQETGGVVSPDQERMIAHLKLMGYEVRVAKGFREFFEIIEWWMKGVSPELYAAACAAYENRAP